MGTNKHSKLSPSSAHRWGKCTPSVALESMFENTESEAAKEGTAAHELAEYKLSKLIGLPVGEKPTSAYDSTEMEGYTDDYVAFVSEAIEEAKRECKDPTILIETTMDLSAFAPESFGTTDCAIVADKTLQIIDFKYGIGVVVDAENNPQMMMYAAGFLDMFSDLYDITTVKMSIFQPRRDNCSTWQIDAIELLNWAECELKPKAELAIQGLGEYVPGEHCQFCKAAAVCKARAKENLKLAKYEFKKADLLTDDEIADVLLQIDDLISWANEIKDFALANAINHGTHYKGFKLVEGRSVRKYADEVAVANAAEAAGYTDIYKRSLITLTELEKKMGKNTFNEILGNLIVKPAGKPTLVKASDKRPEIFVGDVKTEFTQER